MKAFAALLTLFLFALLPPLPAQISSKPAASPITSVQSSLQEQEFYFGEPSGVMDEETRAALRRFQIHRGLVVSGEMDAATLQALQAGNTDGKDGGSVRALAQETAQSDQQFLKRLEGKAAAASPVPAAPAARATPAARETALEPAQTTPRPAAPPHLAPGDAITQSEAAAFVRSYLKAAEGPQPDREVSFYADQVDYFDSGKVSRSFVAKDQQNYYRRWTNREFTLTSGPDLVSADADRALVRLRLRYSVRGPEGKASGSTEEILHLRRTDNGLKISGIKERKL